MREVWGPGAIRGNTKDLQSNPTYDWAEISSPGVATATAIVCLCERRPGMIEV
jgi:hypothetical protein